tara:strand:- start:258 stop:404 length:147 start_codon:yes stop_codon:yes gene_type:complete
MTNIGKIFSAMRELFTQRSSYNNLQELIDEEVEKDKIEADRKRKNNFL